MNKSQLIEALAQKTGLSRANAEFIVNETFKAMTEALVNGEGVEIRGFGSFSIREYEAYEGRNPKTGERIKVPPKKLPFFKVGKELRDRVKNKVAITE